MKKPELLVKHIPLAHVSFTYADMAEALSGAAWHPLEQANWSASYPYMPWVSFQIVHGVDYLYLHFTVQEEYIKAQYVRPNESVWEDSCVEFFISFDQGAHYYNLEFNALGTGLIGYGTAVKQERKRLSADLIDRVHTVGSVVNCGPQKQWSLIWKVPIAVFAQSGLSQFSGVEATANFYKCGDNLPRPHFISWRKVEVESPNFHQPQFFGSLSFE